MINGMSSLMLDVAAFHRATDTPIAEVPSIPSDERVKLRLDLISEEFFELLDSLGWAQYGADFMPDPNGHRNIVATADALADLVYVIIGTALEFGIPLDEVWAEVQRANLAKIGADGKVHKRADGKVLKPEGWMPPDIAGVLQRAREKAGRE